MGQGWKIVNEDEISRKKCSCGQGDIITFKKVEESDYPPFERESEYHKTTCPNKCYK